MFSHLNKTIEVQVGYTTLFNQTKKRTNDKTERKKRLKQTIVKLLVICVCVCVYMQMRNLPLPNLKKHKLLNHSIRIAESIRIRSPSFNRPLLSLPLLNLVEDWWNYWNIWVYKNWKIDSVSVIFSPFRHIHPSSSFIYIHDTSVSSLHSDSKTDGIDPDCEDYQTQILI